jgi:hypothetical protein
MEFISDIYECIQTGIELDGYRTACMRFYAYYEAFLKFLSGLGIFFLLLAKKISPH